MDLFGDYWHSKAFAEKYGKKWESPEDRIAHFRKYGFDCLIAWEKKLKNEAILLEKLRQFNESHHDFKNT
jgi:G:T-mismatch repair DNA endonuclease (very short patch repair protein)